jgi:hypothetical protein
MTCFAHHQRFLYTLTALMLTWDVPVNGNRSKRSCFLREDVATTRFKSFPHRFLEQIFLTEEEFNFIVQHLHSPPKTKLAMTFENKVLLVLLFVIQYHSGKALSLLFNCSQSYVTEVLDEMLPLLVEFFCQFIPNKVTSEVRSILHPQICGIVDNTPHRMPRPFSTPQEVHFNGRYQMHCRMTQMLLDFENEIVAFVTNIPGRTHDGQVAIYNRDFAGILCDSFCIGDSAFNGAQFIVPGFKNFQVKTTSQKLFDRVSRKEQKAIEHVNQFIKDCRSINKADTFRHGEHRLVGCVFISVGMYNMKLRLGCFRRR